MVKPPLKTDLILRGRVVGRPVTFVGTMEGGKLTQISGSATLNVSLSSILADLKADYGEATEVLTQLVGNDGIVLEKLGAAYRSGDSKSVQVGLIIKFAGSSIQFALLKGMGAQKGFIVGLDLRSDKLALPKNFLSGLIGDISIGNLGVYYASEEFKEISFFGAEAFQDTLTLKTPQVTGRKFSEGVNFSAEILIGGVNLLDQLSKIQKVQTTEPERSKAPPAQNGEATKAKETLAKGPTSWIEANKTIGPLSVRRIGLSYADQKIGIKLDAGLHLSVLTLTLEGLGLTYPITKFPTGAKDIWDNLKFHLDGATVSFSAGPLTIGGGLLKVEDPKYPDRLQLDGFLLIRTKIFTITAIGSYANMAGTPSLFVFAALIKELGGPAFFFVTGLAVGLGINRALKLPAIEEVQNFPLVKAATDRKYLAENIDLRDMSRKLGDYIYPLKGNFWIAAGVKFNSFGFIQSFAMLTVSFGTQFEIALLGLSKISVPMQLGDVDVPPIACAELAIKIAFSPAAGVLSAEARLTDNSFLFSKDCRLTGGFAFYVWFARENEGDFVVTLGGYHAKFVKPLHYPLVPRLGIHWQLGTTLSITGEAYFALTPSCLMAGGKLDVVFQAGPIRAWVYAHADFIIAWKPFYYDIDVGVRIGVSLQLVIFTLTVELAASVHIWGPPFGGIAHVTWFVISFDIPLGKQEPDKPEELTWEEFHQSFLPQSTAPEGDPLVSTIRITGGLISERDLGEGDEKRTLRLVNAHEFSFTTESVIPSTKVILNEAEVYEPESEPILGIRPMGKETLHSEHKVSLLRNGASRNGWGEEYLDVKPVPKNVPYALWSHDVSPLKTPSAEMIKSVPGGLRVLLKTREPIHPLEPIDLEKFRYEEFPKCIPWMEIQVPKEIPAHGEKTLMNTIWNNPTVTKKRNAILDALGKTTKDIESIDLPDLAANAKRIYQAMPEMACLGEPLKPPKSN